MVPVAVGAPQFWIDDYIVCSPFQCLKVFQHADFVITDTFHGTIFSAKYARKFRVLVRDSNQNKLLDLVERLNLTEHLMESFGQLQTHRDEYMDTEMISALLSEEKKHSLNYLRSYLQ